MPIFSDLSPEEKSLIAGFPVRAAFFISHADDIDGEADDANEKKAMISAMRAMVKHHEDSDLIKGLAAFAFESRTRWDGWEDGAFQVLSEAPGVMNKVLSLFGKDEARHYRALVLEVSEAVAAAHGEFAAFDDDAEEGFWAGLAGRIAGKIKDSQAGGGGANISATEGGALSELAAALKIPE